MTIEEFKKWAEVNGWVLLNEKSWENGEDTYTQTFWATPSGYTPYIVFKNRVVQ